MLFRGVLRNSSQFSSFRIRIGFSDLLAVALAQAALKFFPRFCWTVIRQTSSFEAR